MNDFCYSKTNRFQRPDGYLRRLRGSERAQRHFDTGRAQLGHTPHQRQIAIQHIARLRALLLARLGALVAHASDEG